MVFTEQDRIMLTEVHAALFGVNGQDGCLTACSKMKTVLYGDPLADDNELKDGIVVTVRQHRQREDRIIADHEKFRTRVWGAILAVLGTVVSSIAFLLHVK